MWAPDMFGSAAFLIASHLAWLAVCHRPWCVHRDDTDWWIAALNYAGSIMFMAAAVAYFTLTTTGNMLNTTIVNTGTFLGALGFLVGAYLLLPPSGAREGPLEVLRVGRLREERERTARQAVLTVLVGSHDLHRDVPRRRILLEMAQHVPAQRVGQEYVQ